MSNHGLLLRLCKISSLVLTLGVSMNACATSTFTWKEEVLLHDGKKIVVERSDTYDSSMPHELGQGPPLAEHKTTFVIPGTNQIVTWKSDNRSLEDADHLRLLSIDFLDGVPYVATTPYSARAYAKWNRPNPPYVFFKYDNKWSRITIESFPEQFTVNVLTSIKNEQYKEKVSAENRNYGFLRAETIAKVNREPGKSIESYSILRAPLDYGPPRLEHKGPRAPNLIVPPVINGEK
jgi:hypothetical protein